MGPEDRREMADEPRVIERGALPSAALVALVIALHAFVAWVIAQHQAQHGAPVAAVSIAVPAAPAPVVSCSCSCAPSGSSP